MFTSKKKIRKKILAQRILMGLLTAGVLCGGVFVSQAEAAAQHGEYNPNKATVNGDTKACNNTRTEVDDWSPGEAKNFIYTLGSVSSGITANANNNELSLAASAQFSAFGSSPSYKYAVYGGFVNYGAHGNADGNKIIITSTSNGYNLSNLVGGFSGGGNADTNTVNINGGVFSDGIYIYGGHAPYNSGSGTYGSASKNTVDISNGTFGSGTYIRGGEAAGNADENTVNIKGGNFNNIKQIYGGSSTTAMKGTADKNTVNISDGTITITEDIMGGRAALQTNSNKVAISGGKVSTRQIFSGFSWNGQTVKDNEVKITGGTVETEQIYGGYSQKGSSKAVIEANRVEITGGTVRTDYIYGGDAYEGIAKGNSVTIGSGAAVTKKSFSDIRIYGGSADYTRGRAEENTVTIGADLADAVVYGGFANQNATGNKVIVKSGNITGSITGAFSNKGTASGNTLVLEGGTIDSFSISGGRTSSGEATGNIVELRGTKIIGSVQGGEGPNVHDNIIKVYAGDLSAALLNSDKIEIYGKNLNIQHITDFNQLDFYIPKEAVNGDTLVNITETWGTELAEGTKVNAGVMAGSKLKEGDTLTLLHDAAGITNNGAVTGKLTEGVSLEHEVDIAIEANDIKATIHNNQTPPKPDPKPDPKPGPKLKEATKVLAETRAGGIAMLRSGSDLMTGKGLTNAQLAADAAGAEAAGQGAQTGAAGFTPFAVIGGSNMQYETGSYVNVRGWGLNIGMARKLHYKNSTVTIAPLAEYGRGNYDSHLEDSLNTRGDGTQQYFGIGCMVKDEKKDGMYYEGGLRIGRMKGDYKGAIEGRGTGYDTESNYYALQAGIGKVFKSSGKSKWDVYGKFFWTHQAADNGVALKGAGTGEFYDFAAVNSYRLRLGTRWTQDISQGQQVYAGIAWDYEFDSDARASFKGMSTPTPSLKGSSGMLELGWQVKSNQANPLSIDLNLTGWCGKQKGVQFGAGFDWSF